MNGTQIIQPVFADPRLLRYAADAMNTTFRIFVRGVPKRVADLAISEAFQKLDELEQLLSRYVPDSDISRINVMKPGSSLFLSDECDACLRLAMEACALTGGRFDPTAGALVDAVKGGSEDLPPLSGQIALDPHRPLVTCVAAGRIMDLGAIGKGFALERMASILAVHDVEEALLTSGASTLLAVGGRAWPVDLPHTLGARRIALCNSAIGASDNSQQGVHIVDPATGHGAERFQNIWVEHPSAAFADAFSTACFVMTPHEIAEFCDRVPGHLQVISDPDWEISARLPQD